MLCTRAFLANPAFSRKYESQLATDTGQSSGSSASTPWRGDHGDRPLKRRRGQDHRPLAAELGPRVARQDQDEAPEALGAPRSGGTDREESVRILQVLRDREVRARGKGRSGSPVGPALQAITSQAEIPETK